MSAVDYESITDETKLQKMLTDTQDFDERKIIRQRIRDIRDKQKAELEAKRKSKTADETQRRQKLAEEDKQRRLDQYSNIAKDPNMVRKDDPRLNVDVVRDMAKVNEATKQKTLDNVRDMASQSSTSGSMGSQSERLVQLRQKEAEDLKQKKLQRYDEMAKQEVHSKTETLETQDGTTKTITTTTTKEGADGSKVISRQQKTTTTVSGLGGTVYGAKPARPQGGRGAMAAFKQMDSSANPGAGRAKPNYLGTGAGGGGGGAKGVTVQRSPSAIKQMLIGWCASMTRGYEGVNVTNFSSSWSDGLAFCALIHHFHPEAFEFSELKAKHRRHNFTIAFEAAEKYADIAPLLDVEDMVRMKNPDWKCVFTAVQSYYRKFRNHECSIHKPVQPPTQ